jgi:hypothetical protein
VGIERAAGRPFGREEDIASGEEREAEVEVGESVWAVEG